MVRDDEEEFTHTVTPWTVGQLRAALAGVPDDTPLVVETAEEPGGPLADTQVVYDAGYATGQDNRDSEPRRSREFVLSCEFPSGRYLRRRRP